MICDAINLGPKCSFGSDWTVLSIDASIRDDSLPDWSLISKGEILLYRFDVLGVEKYDTITAGSSDFLCCNSPKR